MPFLQTHEPLTVIQITQPEGTAVSQLAQKKLEDRDEEGRFEVAGERKLRAKQFS